MRAPASAETGGDRALLRSQLVLYGLPFAAYMAVSMPLNMWLLKYATDVLLIAPAAIGAIMLGARLWDAVSDPMAGYLSDRTQSRLGRRRSWLVASAPWMAITLVMVWSPPTGLESGALLLWMAVALILWETASTAFYIPYQALGLELTYDYHERTRLFAWRHIVTMLGFAMGLLTLELLKEADVPREAAFSISAASGLVLTAVVVAASLGVHERAEHQGRGPARVTRAFADVLRNPHARILFYVYAVELFGTGVMSVLSPYLMEDVVGRPDLLVPLIAGYMVPQFLFVPLWTKLSRRFGKKRLWLFGLGASSMGFLGQIFLYEGAWQLVFALVILVGVGMGIGTVVSPSLQADVVDYDEMRSGERKEGAYSAVWNFIRKSGLALAAGVAGLALSTAGYDGAAETQSAEVADAIRFTVSLLPTALYLSAIFILSRFSLDEVAHAEIRRRIGEQEH